MLVLSLEEPEGCWEFLWINGSTKGHWSAKDHIRDENASTDKESAGTNTGPDCCCDATGENLVWNTPIDEVAIVRIIVFFLFLQQQKGPDHRKNQKCIQQEG